MKPFFLVISILLAIFLLFNDVIIPVDKISAISHGILDKLKINEDTFCGAILSLLIGLVLTIVPIVLAMLLINWCWSFL